MTDQGNKPVLDEQTFEKLLEAAYVLQEHNRKRRELEENLESQSEQLREQDLANQALLEKSKRESEDISRAKNDYTLTLAEIVEAQRQIQMRHLDLEKALSVVAERVARITSASGAAIGILEGSTIRYRAGAGSPALLVGTEVPLQNAICQANVRTGQTIRTEEMDTEFLFDPEPCRQRGIQSLIAVPIHYDGNIVGALELYFDKIHGFAEQDIHTCQLMAGLVTEAIGRDAELTVKNSMAAERSKMLATIERLNPGLNRSAPPVGDRSASAESTDTFIRAATTVKSPCWKCGTQSIAEEQFCGKCGAARASDTDSHSMQSKLAAARQMQQKNQGDVAAVPPNGTAPLVAATRSALSEKDWNEVHSEEAIVVKEQASDEQNADAPSAMAVKLRHEDVAVWSSAQNAQDFLESLSATRTPGALARFWRSRRGDIYLGLALVLVAVVIRWGIWSDHSVVATGRGAVSSSTTRKRPAPDPDLSAFDKLLISLGLAEAPDEPPQYKGNPDTQVWVDLNTALYYCPGSDLYGKTQKGRLSSQHDAQLDQFEPANRRACE